MTSTFAELESPRRRSLEFQQLASETGWELEFLYVGRSCPYRIVATRGFTSVDFALDFDGNQLCYFPKNLSQVMSFYTISKMTGDDVDSIFTQSHAAEETVTELQALVNLKKLGVSLSHMPGPGRRMLQTVVEKDHMIIATIRYSSPHVLVACVFKSLRHNGNARSAAEYIVEKIFSHTMLKPK